MADPTAFTFRRIAILRGIDAENAVRQARAAWDVGFDLVEVPLQSDAARQALAALIGLAGRGAVGAGTVTSPEDVRAAAELGAEALVSPATDATVSEAARSAGLPLIPGVMTPSEVVKAQKLGHDVVKLFPASALGASYLKALRDPFPEVRFIVVGGVSPDSIRELARAGAWGVGVSSDLHRFLKEPDALEHI